MDDFKKAQDDERRPFRLADSFVNALGRIALCCVLSVLTVRFQALVCSTF